MSNANEPRVNLAYRLDNLCEVVGKYETDSSTEPAVREVVALIRASSEFHNMDALAKAAGRVESAGSAEFAARLRELIVIMQQEVSRQGVRATTVLIVSSDKAFVTELRIGLEARGYPVMVAETPSEANRILDARVMGCCIVDQIFDRVDGRNYIADLRASPVTAAMVLVSVGPRLGPDGIGSQPGSEADVYFEKPVKTSDVVNFLNVRLKRGPVGSRQARRDPTTGTPNRAACREAYGQIQESCSDREPISFALFGIHRFNTLVKLGGPVARETLIRQTCSLLSAAFRASDVVARWGTSEFAIIMPGEDQYGATKAIEKILPALNSQSITTPAGKNIPITLCAGLTVVNNQTPLDDAAATAECHLYMAFHNAWQNPRRNWLVPDAIHVSRRSESIALLLTDPTVSKVIQNALERETFKVELFSSASSLQSALERQSFNLLITDDGFPGGDGFEILEHLRSLPVQQRMRTIMIVEGDAGIGRALKLGVHDYAVKPLSMHRFRSQILRLLWQREEVRSHARMTIMVVDHDVPQLLIAGTSLHQLGECRVLLAHGHKDAIRRLPHVQPHYLILDATMPEMQCEEFLSAIPKLDWLKNMEIILGTNPGVMPPAMKTNYKVLGMVSRPYRPVKFIKEIRSMIPLLQDETPSPSPVDPAPLEAEVQRILSMQASR